MRLMRCFGVMLLLALGVAFCGSARVSAETSGYPYTNKPCVWAPYASHSSVPYWCNDYDWGDRAGDTSAANVMSPYGYYYRNCTDYTAWKAASQGVPAAIYKGLGNAKDWAVKAQARGVRVDTTPAAGSVAVRTTGQYGHTAFVETVDDNGAVTVSQYNYRADGNYSQISGQPADMGFTLFVHFEDYFTQSEQQQPAPQEPQPVEADNSTIEPAPDQNTGLMSDESPQPQQGLLNDESPDIIEVSATSQHSPNFDQPSAVPTTSPSLLAITSTPSPAASLQKAIHSPPSSPYKPPSLPPDKPKTIAAHSPPVSAKQPQVNYLPLAGLTVATLLAQVTVRRPRL